MTGATITEADVRAFPAALAGTEGPLFAHCRSGIRSANLFASGMDRQTLQDWVHRYNDEGINGLRSPRSPGRALLLAAAQKDELHALVIAGPDPQFHKVARWRWVDLRAESPGGFQWRCMRLPRAPGCINLA